MRYLSLGGKMAGAFIMPTYRKRKSYFCSEEIKLVKEKTSVKRRKSSINTSRLKKIPKLKLKKGSGVRKSNPREELLDEELIGRAIWECLKDGDSEGVIEVIRIHLEAVNKTQIAKESEMARSTMYHTLKSKNPTVKTLAKLVHACV